MQEGNKARPELTLKVIAPDGEALAIECESVRLPLADDKNGKGGGSIGIRIGHTKAEIALKSGKITALRAGITAGAVEIDGGFALVDDNTVTVITDTIKK